METEAEHDTVSHKCLLIFSTKGNELVYLACVLCFILVDEIHHKESETHINTLFRKKNPKHSHCTFTCKSPHQQMQIINYRKNWIFFSCLYFVYLESCSLNWQSEYMSDELRLITARPVPRYSLDFLSSTRSV